VSRQVILLRISFAETDIIKIKGKEGTWTYIYLNSEDDSCRIYEAQPLESRRLKCRDTREIENIYAVDRLKRKDLIS